MFLFELEIAYNAKGQRLLIAYGNTQMTRYVYDIKTFRLLRLKTERYSLAPNTYAPQSGNTRQDFAYEYDLTGNILKIKDRTPQCGVGGGNALDKDFHYDALYRLLSATGRENQPTTAFPGWMHVFRGDVAANTESYTQNYSYDKMGNILQLQHTANNSNNSFTRNFNYPSSNNILNSITVGSNTYNFIYDANGNLVKENSERNFEWDYADHTRVFRNQIINTAPTIYTHYLYDAGGNRAKKLTWTGGNWETIIYIDGIIEYREDNNGNRQSISHIMDDKKRIATVREGFDFGELTPPIKYNLDDHLGSSTILLDMNGGSTLREEYYPFGETSFGSYDKKKYRYCGKEKDEESGLYYYGARYYQTWSCRFISVDPIASKYPFYTPYQYAGNKPIISIDIDGLETDAPIGQQSPATNFSYSINQSDLPQSTINANQQRIYEYKVNQIQQEQGPQSTPSTLPGDRVKVPELNTTHLNVETTKHSVQNAGGHLAEKKAQNIIKKNVETGKRVDTFGKVRQSPRQAVDAETRALRGESKFVHQGGSSARGKWTTNTGNYITPNVKRFRIASETFEVIGEAITFTEILRAYSNHGDPFAAFPLGALAAIQFEELSASILETTFSQGYKATKNLVNIKKDSPDLEGVEWIYATEEEWNLIMNGDITSYSQLDKNVLRTEELGNAVLVQEQWNNTFKVWSGFRNIK